MFDFRVFLMTLERVTYLLMLIGVGYAFRRSGKLNRDAAKMLSFLSTHVFNPSYSFRSLAENFTGDQLIPNLVLVGLSTALFAGSVLIGKLLSKLFSRSDFESRTLTMVFTFTNISYFGYPVIEGVFGEALLAKFIVFALPFNLGMYTYGYGLFAGERVRHPYLKTLTSPLFLFTLAGCIFGITGLSLPSILDMVVDATAACMSPVSMITGGLVLGAFPIAHFFNRFRPYLYSFFRLVGIPLLFGLILFALGVRGEMLFLGVLVVALPVGLNTVVYPESFGYDAPDNARICFISYVMAIFTLPLWFSILSGITGMYA